MTLRIPLPAHLRFFRKDERGTVAIIVAVMMVVLVTVVGAAVDFARAYRLQAVLQAAADGAGLAAGAEASRDVNKMRTVMENYVRANADVSGWAHLGAVSVAYNPATEVITIDISGDVGTSFLGVAGLTKLNVRAKAEVRRASPGPMEVVLALDTTRSMNDRPTGGTEAKIVTLRKAAKSLVNRVMQSPSGAASIGIVPYSAYINVGTSDPSPSWVNVPPPKTVSSCTLFGPLPGGCTGEYYDCYVDGVWKVKACYRTVPSTCQRPCLESTQRTWVWRGCIGARTDGIPNQMSSGTERWLDSIESPTAPAYPGFFHDQLGGCTAEILDLTRNLTTLTAKIDTLPVFGDTYIPSGLLWAWNVLDPRAPYTTAKSLADLQSIGGKKVIVLMTDGINWQVPRFRDGLYWLRTIGKFVRTGGMEPSSTH